MKKAFLSYLKRWGVSLSIILRLLWWALAAQKNKEFSMTKSTQQEQNTQKCGDSSKISTSKHTRKYLELDTIVPLDNRFPTNEEKVRAKQFYFYSIHDYVSLGLSTKDIESSMDHLLEQEDWGGLRGITNAIYDIERGEYEEPKSIIDEYRHDETGNEDTEQ